MPRGHNKRWHVGLEIPDNTFQSFFHTFQHDIDVFGPHSSLKSVACFATPRRSVHHHWKYFDATRVELRMNLDEISMKILEMLRMPALWWETDHGLIPQNEQLSEKSFGCTKELGEWCCMGSRSRKQRERKNCDRPEMNALENCRCHGSLQFHGRWKWCIAWLILRLWFFSPNRCPEISWGSSNHTAKALDHCDFCAFWGACFPSSLLNTTSLRHVFGSLLEHNGRQGWSR